MKHWILIFFIFSLPLASEVKVVAITGSLRKDSYNGKLVKQAAQIAKTLGASVTILDLKDFPMPFYDGDLEESKGMPEAARRFRRILIESDAVIISTPEYNGSISGVLKNAIDWATRTEEGNPSPQAFKGKKFAIMSASPGKLGGEKALNHLRTILERLGGEVIEKQVSIGTVHLCFENGGKPDFPLLKEEIGELISKATD